MRPKPRSVGFQALLLWVPVAACTLEFPRPWHSHLENRGDCQVVVSFFTAAPRWVGNKQIWVEMF